MSRIRFVLLLCVITLLAMPVSLALARYIRPELDNVPVERLVKNLEELAGKDEKDARIRFNLARVHAMAFALKTDTAKVNKRQANEAWFGYEAPHVPFKNKSTDDEAKLKEAKAHLAKAIQRYEEAIKLDPKMLSAKLGHAWCIEQSQDKEKAIETYRAVIDEAWKVEKDKKVGGLGWHSVTAEAAGYLIPLLDEEKNEKEIADLKERIEKMNRLPRPVTPIVVPLREGLGVKDLEDRAASVAFDADGTGLMKKWTWLTKDAGWLVYDQRGTRDINSALQLFGGVTFWTFWDTGYDALAALDDNRDGELRGDELKHIAIWRDANGNAMCDEGEVKPLAEWGIVALSCKAQRDEKHPARIAFSPRGVTFRDGSTRATYDIILKQR